MTTTHNLKIWPQHWERIFEGSKTFEIRVNDRAFQKGDKVVLRPWDKEERKYLTHAPFHDLHRTIGDVYPIDAERVVFSLLKEKKDA
jgi:hypothetical protein